jgi:hypothetical protein
LDIEAEQNAQVPKVARIPDKPSQKEIDEHETTHLPFQAWCQDCVSGRAKENPHWQQKDKQEKENADTGETIVQVDFMFLKHKKDQNKKLTVLCAKVDGGPGIAAQLWSKSVADEYAVKSLVGFLRDEGLSSGCVLQYDPEGGARTICEKTADICKKVKVRQTPRKSHASNGSVGRFHQAVQGQTRTFKSMIQREYKTELDLDHPIVAWLIRHSGWSITRFQKNVTGKTLFQKARGHECKDEVLIPGEVCEWKEPGEQRAKLELAWTPGVWLGRTTDSNEHLVGTANGVLRTRTVRRRPKDKRFDKTIFESFIGSPWDLKGYKTRPEVRVRLGAEGRTANVFAPTPGCSGCVDNHKCHHNNNCKLRRAAFGKVAETADDPPSVVVPMDVDQEAQPPAPGAVQPGAAPPGPALPGEPRRRIRRKADGRVVDAGPAEAMDAQEEDVSMEEQGEKRDGDGPDGNQKGKKSPRIQLIEDKILAVIEMYDPSMMPMENVDLEFDVTKKAEGRKKEMDNLKDMKVYRYV